MKRLALTLIVVLAASGTLTGDASASDRSHGHSRSSVGHTVGHLLFGGHGYSQAYNRPSYGHYGYQAPSYSHGSYGYPAYRSFGHGYTRYGHRGGAYSAHVYPSHS